MPGAIIAIDQDRPGGTSFGTPGVARKDLWKDRTVRPRCSTTGNSSYLWTLLAVPPGSGTTVVPESSELVACEFDPDRKGSYRLQLATNGGGPGNIQILILAVTFDEDGVLLGRGWRMPAFGEQGAENNFDGQADGWDPAIREMVEDILANAFGGGGGVGGADDGVALRASRYSRGYNGLKRSTDLTTGDGEVLGVAIVDSFGATATAPILYYVTDVDGWALRSVNTVTKVGALVSVLSEPGYLFSMGNTLLVMGETQCFIKSVPSGDLSTVSLPVGATGLDGYAAVGYAPELEQAFWYFTANDDSLILRVELDPESSVVADVAFTGGGPESTGPKGIVVDNEGCIWVAYKDSDVLQKYTVDADGNLVAAGAAVAGRVTSNLVFDGKYIFGCENNPADGDKIVRIRVADGDVTLFDGEGITGSSWVAFDGVFLWVTTGRALTAFHPETFEVMQRIVEPIGNDLTQVVADVRTGSLYVAAAEVSAGDTVLVYSPGHHLVLDSMRLGNVAPGQFLRTHAVTGQVVGGADPGGGGGGGPSVFHCVMQSAVANTNLAGLGSKAGLGTTYLDHDLLLPAVTQELHVYFQAVLETTDVGHLAHVDLYDVEEGEAVATLSTDELSPTYLVVEVPALAALSPRVFQVRLWMDPQDPAHIVTCSHAAIILKLEEI